MTAMYKFCWVLWIGGTVLIVASWIDVVTPTIGWVGFVVALTGTLLSFGAQHRPPQSRPKTTGTESEDQRGMPE